MEIELWRIGSSDRAPKLNIVSAPNDWSRTVRAQASELTPAKRLYLEYWTSFRKVLDVSGGPAKGTKPLAESWMNIAIGRTGFQLEATVSTQKGRIQAGSRRQVELAGTAPLACEPSQPNARGSRAPCKEPQSPPGEEGRKRGRLNEIERPRWGPLRPRHRLDGVGSPCGQDRSLRRTAVGSLSSPE